MPLSRSHLVQLFTFYSEDASERLREKRHEKEREKKRDWPFETKTHSRTHTCTHIQMYKTGIINGFLLLLLLLSLSLHLHRKEEGSSETLVLAGPSSRLHRPRIIALELASNKTTKKVAFEHHYGRRFNNVNIISFVLCEVWLKGYFEEEIRFFL